jgi:acyl carrier protein
MNTSVAQIQEDRFGATILAWPHKEPNIVLTETEVQAKVTSVLATEFGLSPGQLRGDSLIKEDLDVDWYDLAAPIMTIENFFRTMLQDEVAREDVSVHSIVDKLLCRTSRSQDCGASNRRATSKLSPS